MSNDMKLELRSELKASLSTGAFTLLWDNSFTNKHINHFISKRATADSHFHKQRDVF